MAMQIKTGFGECATIKGADGIVWTEAFTAAEFANLADMLEGLNTPNNGGSPLRRLTDMLWALQNDSSACVVALKDDMEG